MNQIGKSKAQMDMELLMKIIIGLILLVLVLIGISYLVVKDFSLLEFIKNMFRTRG